MAPDLTEEWLSLEQAAALLRRAHKPRHPQSLYDRIRRGTLPGVQRDRKWFIPRRCVDELLREPYHSQGGRPRIKDTATFIRRKPRRAVEIPDSAEVARILRLPIAKRAAMALRAHVLVRNTIRGRLERQFPQLSPREISLRVAAELARG